MDQPAKFFVCMYIKDDRKIAHAVSLESNFPATVDEAREFSRSKERKKTEQVSNFASRFEDFVKSVIGFIEFVPLILALTPQFTDNDGRF